MPRTMVEVITDDYTGETHQPHEVEDVVLKFGYREWKLVLTPESKAAIDGLIDPFTKGLPVKDTTPAWVKVSPHPDDQGTETSTEQPRTVTIVPPDTKTVRDWWKSLTSAQCRTLGLKDPPSGNTGRVPENVTAAFVETHKPSAPAVPPAAFSGQ